MAENAASGFLDQRLLAMVESAPDAMLLVDERGRILLVNRQVELMFGHTREHLVGREIELLIPTRFRGAHGAHRTRYRVEPTIRAMGAGLDLWALRADGTEFPVEISLSPITDEHGTTVVAAVRDVSDRLAMDAQLHLTQASIDATQDGVFMFRPDTLEFSYVNQGAVSQTGYTRDELSRMTPLHIKPEFTKESFVELITPLIQGDMIRRTLETVHRDKQGNDTAVEISLEYPPATHPSAERVMVALVRDITERRASDEERERQQRWLEGLSEIRNHLLTDGSIHEVFEILCHRVCAITAADSAFVRAPEIIDGSDNIVASYPRDSAAVSEPERANTISIPLVTADRLIGDLVVSRDDSDHRFDPADVQIAESFAHQAAAAIEVTRARSDRQRLRLLEDRDRIARDLHDLVIQRLFATGMSLQSMMSSWASPPGAVDRLGFAVKEIDTAIDELRTAIFGLHTVSSDRELTAQIHELVEDHADRLGFSPVVELSGRVDHVHSDVADDLMATLTEALSNVARHAKATAAEVAVEVSGEHVTLRVTDNGTGIPAQPVRGNGLSNMAIRAERLRGMFEVADGPDGGTAITWSVPVDSDSSHG